MAKRKAKRGCDCIEKANKLLSKYNTKLSIGWTFDGDFDFFPRLEVEKVDRKVRGSAKPVVPAFCPFCGRKYETQISKEATKR